jgi:hypothetical protein
MASTMVEIPCALHRQVIDAGRWRHGTEDLKEGLTVDVHTLDWPRATDKVHCGDDSQEHESAMGSCDEPVTRATM